MQRFIRNLCQPKNAGIMRNVFAFSLFIIIGMSCEKQAAKNAGLSGVWVEKTNRLDTLVIYSSGGKDMMFDNSAAYRSYPVWASNYAFRYEFKVNADKIGFRAAGSTADFMWYDFHWNSKEEFTMRYNGLRPYLSSIGDISYVSIK